MKQPPSNTFPPYHNSLIPTPIEDPSLLRPAQPGRARKLILISVILVLVLSSAGGFAYVLYQKHVNIHPAHLLPKDTIVYLELANFNHPSEDSTWQKFEDNLRQFPALADFDVYKSLGDSFSLRQQSAADEALNHAFASPADIIIGITSLPQLPGNVSDYSLAALHQVLAPHSPTPPQSIAGATTNNDQAETSLLIFIPLSENINLTELLNDLLESESVDLEPLEKNQAFRIRVKNEGADEDTEFFAALAGKYLVFAPRQDAIISLVEKYSFFNAFNPPESYFDTPAYSALNRNREHNTLVSFAFNTDAPFFREALKNYASESTPPLPPYFSGQAALANDGISLTTRYPNTLPAPPPASTGNQDKLLAALPEKLAGQWISLFYELEIGESERKTCAAATPSLYIQQFCSKGFLGLTPNELDPLLSSARRLAVLVAPRYDGKPPHAALILATDSEDVPLYQNAEHAFVALEEYFTRQAELMQSAFDAPASSVPITSLTPLQLQTLHVPSVTRKTVDHYGKTITSLESTLLTLPIELSFTVLDNQLIVAADQQSVREILDAMREYHSVSPLLQNGSVQFQLGRHPDASSSLAYLYPRGLVGLLNWVSSSFLHLGENPKTAALMSLIDTHLQVVRTIGSTTTVNDEEMTQKTFIQIVSLPKQQKQQAIQALRKFDFDLSLNPATGP